jgi:hypothetical protein
MNGLWKGTGTLAGIKRLVLSSLVCAGVLFSAVWAGDWCSLRGSPMVAVPLRFVEVHDRQQPWRLREAAPPPAGRTPFTAVYGANVVRQDFRSPANNLSRLGLWMAGPARELVTLTLHDRSSGERWQAQCQIADEPGATYYDVPLALADAKGRDLELTLSAPDATYQAPVVLRIAPGDRLGGLAFHNLYPIAGNLDLAAYHRGFPGRWWLDVVGERLVPGAFRSRVRQYKPGALKGRAFGLLVVTSLTLSALALLAGAWSIRGAWWTLPITALAVLGFVALRTSLRSAGDPVCRLVPASETPGLGEPTTGQASRPTTASPVAQPHVYYDMLAHLGEATWDLTRAHDRGQAQAEMRAGSAGPRPGLAVAAGYSLAWRVRVPPGARFRSHLVPMRETLFELEVSTASTRETLLRERVADVADDGRPAQVDLSAFAGQWVKITLRCPEGAGFWAAPQILTDGEWLQPYPLPASLAEQTQVLEGIQLGETIELLGFALHSPHLRPGESVQLDLYWHAMRKVQTDYTVFVHLLDKEGAFATGYDSWPALRSFPTTLWPSDAVVVDRRTVPLPADLSPGAYRLAVGLYDLDTLERVPITDAAGNPMLDSKLILPAVLHVRR